MSLVEPVADLPHFCNRRASLLLMLQEGAVSELEKLENSKADGIITDFRGEVPGRLENIEARLDADPKPQT